MKIKLSSGILCLSLISAMSHAAIPYKGQTYQYTQPNGEKLTLSLDGNDYYAEQRTTTGKLVIYDADLKGMAYAKVSQDGSQLISTGELATEKTTISTNALSASKFVKHYQAQQGLSRAARLKLAEQARDKLLQPETSQYSWLMSSKTAVSDKHVIGKIQGLTIMIQFPDEAGTMTKTQINNFLNAENYSEFNNKESIRGYYQSVSAGKVDYTNTVVGYYTAKHNKAYYTDESLEFSLRARELITEALNWLENEQGFDFSTLSTDSNKQIRGLNFLYAGTSGGSWSKGLWPHMGWLSPQFCADGVCTSKYQISDMGSSLSIGTFAHESGHLLFDWPDLYDYDGSSYGSVASYGIMGYGAVGYKSMYNPTAPVSPLRDLVGWETITELNPAVDSNAPSGRLSLTNMSNHEYKWTNPNNSGEAFYIEAINQQGQNSEQPGSGLAIYHVDSNGDRDNEWHPYIQMEHADGNRDPENYVNQGDATDVYTEYGEFTATLPNALTTKGTNSLWWDGSESGLTITDVSQPGQTISFLSTASSDTGSSSSEQGNNQETDGSSTNDETNTDTNDLVYAGNIDQYSSVVEPNGSYFQLNQEQVLNISLSGAANTDFGMALYKYQNNEWQAVAVSQTEGSSDEAISYDAQSGYYYVLILAYSGSGQYKLTIEQ
ncbi:M6 family metalloprotease domain-containing protein [Vibrio nitrifigilis]|uniref:M6 family metalloprotease domain-containing protein n=1 Tax=Vibrio nitrifigilis TaxID=2789781 RepID=UPI001E55A542|nr:M6 family metalloprotease domain-containing protein [Vibrio nitrifigilis]